MPIPRSATTRPARNTSTTSFGAITAGDAATSSVTLTPTTRCHWTRAQTTTPVDYLAALAPTATVTSRYGAVGTAATPPVPANNAPRRGARPSRQARSPPVLQREARPPRAKPRLKWQSVCPATGTGAPSELSLSDRLSCTARDTASHFELGAHGTPRLTTKAAEQRPSPGQGGPAH